MIGWIKEVINRDEAKEAAAYGIGYGLGFGVAYAIIMVVACGASAVMANNQADF